MEQKGQRALTIIDIVLFFISYRVVRARISPFAVLFTLARGRCCESIGMIRYPTPFWLKFSQLLRGTYFMVIQDSNN